MIPKEMGPKLKRSLLEHEGYKNIPYVDTKGFITAGIGYNLSTRGLKDSWINEQYEDDVEFFYSKLCEFPWYKDLNQDRQIVLIDMAFMGWQHFIEFHDMIAALAVHDYNKAADEMLASDWARDVKSGRSNALANGMRTGVYNI